MYAEQLLLLSGEFIGHILCLLSRPKWSLIGLFNVQVSILFFLSMFYIINVANEIHFNTVLALYWNVILAVIYMSYHIGYSIR